MPTDRPQGRPASLDGQDLGPARIVIADDDKLHRDTLAIALRSAGHTVEAFEDGQEAVDRVAQGGIHLVMLDVVMPRLSGLEACRLLKGMSSEAFLPVMLVTGKTDAASRIEGLKIGADDYVCKPFDIDELLARVGSMLRLKRMHDHLAAERQKLERMSVVDEATGLYNYRFLNARIPQEFKRAEKMHEPFACLVADIDRLRGINEAHGKGAGDAVIRGVADTLRRSGRDGDVVARYGGEEFLLILPGTHFAGAVAMAERIWRECSELLVDHEGRKMRITISVGASLYPSRDIRTKEALLRAADAALVQAKKEGGNRICVYQQQGYIFTPVSGARVVGPPSTAEPGSATRDPWGKKPV